MLAGVLEVSVKCGRLDRTAGGGGGGLLLLPYETFRSIIDNKKNVSPVLINIGIMLINIINNHVLN